MNSESEKMLSMEELMARNRPAHTSRQAPPSALTSTPQTVSEAPVTAPPENLPAPIPIPPSTPTEQEWREMMSLLRALYRAEQTQITLLERQLQKPIIYATKEQMDEMIRQTRELRKLVERVGRQNEKRSLLSRLRLPKPELPRPEGPGLFLLLWALATLLLFWFVLVVR